MFGLSRREQRWKAEQQALELLVPLVTTLAKVKAELIIAEVEAEAKAKAEAEAKAKDAALAGELEQLRKEVVEMRLQLAAVKQERPDGKD